MKACSRTTVVIISTSALTLLACDDRRLRDPDGGSGASDGGSDPIEEARAQCQLRVDSATRCSEECDAAAWEARSLCEDESGALNGSAEWTDFVACASECPAAFTCTFSGGRVEDHLDCSCASDCLRNRSADFQSLWRASASCHAQTTRGPCY